jgi:hypothetical protein
MIRNFVYDSNLTIFRQKYILEHLVNVSKSYFLFHGRNEANEKVAVFQRQISQMADDSAIQIFSDELVATYNGNILISPPYLGLCSFFKFYFPFCW